MSRLAARPASRFALVASAALSLAACQDATAPTARDARERSSTVNPSAAVVRSTSGQVGKVTTPYPSVHCVGAAGGFEVHVLGATAYPSQMMSASERVTQQVYLYKWTGASWANVSSRVATRTSFPALMPTVGFTSLQSQGYYKVVTKFTWQVYTASGWTNSGTKIVDYNQAADYKGFYAGSSGPGYCYL
jgi:hypothetical protein